MKRRSIAAILMSLAIAAVLAPAAAFAATVEEASQPAVPLTTQAGKNLAKNPPLQWVAPKHPAV